MGYFNTKLSDAHARGEHIENRNPECIVCDLIVERNAFKARVAELEELCREHYAKAESAYSRGLDHGAADAEVRVKELEAEVERRDALIRADGYEDMREYAQALAERLAAAEKRAVQAEAQLSEVYAMDASCQDPACAAHCGYGHLDGCAAILEYLSERGGEHFRGAPSTVRAELRRRAEQAERDMHEVQFAVYGALIWGFDPNSVNKASVLRAVTELARERDEARAEAKNLREAVAEWAEEAQRREASEAKLRAALEGIRTYVKAVQPILGSRVEFNEAFRILNERCAALAAGGGK